MMFERDVLSRGNLCRVSSERQLTKLEQGGRQKVKRQLRNYEMDDD